MKSPISENEALKKAFRDVYGARKREEIDPQWRSRVMKRIDRVGLLPSSSGFWPAFEHMVWKLAPVTCVLALTLAVFFVSMDFGSGYDYLDAARAGMETPTLAELFAFEGKP